MLYKLEIENFHSVRDRQVLDLTIAPNVPDPDGKFAFLFEGSPLRAPKVIALYGANASGKTTVLRALEFVVNFIRDSAQRTVPGFPFDRFNDEESANRPTRLAIELGGVMNLTPEMLERAQQSDEGVEYGLYRYELEIEHVDGTSTRVLSEALRQKPNGQGKWQRVFERDSDGKIKDSRTFSLSGFQHLLNTLKPNVSVLSSFGLFQHPTASVFVGEARKSMFIMEPGLAPDQGVINHLVTQPHVLSELNKELSRIDVGVEGLRFVDSANGPQARFKHSGLLVEMPWMLESHGTRSFIKMFPFITAALAQGSVCAIDEFDSSIHPLVLPEILGWFYSASGRNDLSAQIWFSCHSASLLDDLSKEEMVICEKDRMGRTHIHSLMDVKVRRDENLYRKYMSGAYGGVPQLG